MRRVTLYSVESFTGNQPCGTHSQQTCIYHIRISRELRCLCSIRVNGFTSTVCPGYCSIYRLANKRCQRINDRKNASVNRYICCPNHMFVGFSAGILPDDKTIFSMCVIYNHRILTDEMRKRSVLSTHHIPIAHIHTAKWKPKRERASINQMEKLWYWLFRWIYVQSATKQSTNQQAIK